MEKVKQSIKAADSSLKKSEDFLLATAIKAVSEKKGRNIVSLDLSNIDEAVADYFVLCEAGSAIQIQAICDHVAKTIFDECKEKPYCIQSGDKWTLIDYVNIVIHIFREEERKFYDLEGLWSDGEKTEHPF